VVPPDKPARSLYRAEDVEQWLTKENESSWIFEPRLTCTNALRRVQNPGFALGNSGRIDPEAL